MNEFEHLLNIRFSDFLEGRKAETITGGYEYLGVLWKGQIDGFSHVLKRTGRVGNRSVALDLTALSADEQQRLIPLLPDGIGPQTKPAQLPAKFGKRLDPGVLPDTHEFVSKQQGTLYSLSFTFNEHEQLTYFTCTDLIPEELLQPSAAPLEDAGRLLDALLQKRRQEKGIISHADFMALRPEYFFDPSQLISDKKTRAFDRVWYAVGKFTSGFFSPVKEPGRVVFLTIDFEDPEPAKLPLIEQVLGVPVKPRITAEELIGVLKVEPHKRDSSDPCEQLDFILHSHLNEPYLCIAYVYPEPEYRYTRFTISTDLKLES